MEPVISTTPGRLGKSGQDVSTREILSPYLSRELAIDWSDPELAVCPIHRHSPGLEANRNFFGHPVWAEKYFRTFHRSDRFRDRWQAVTDSWDGRIVVDIGCGPGNVFATVGGAPKLLIGVDVSPGGLKLARGLGYRPVLADAHALPFVSQFADLVILNATLHHCEDMPRVLAEAARIVAPGGQLVTDHDPQLSAWNLRGPARWGWDHRLTVYRGIRKDYHRSWEAQSLMLAAAIHHEPGEGLTADLFHEILPPLGFSVEVYPHNHNVGAEILQGDVGRAPYQYRLAQRLSGINPNSSEAALSLLCRATRHTGRSRLAA